MKENTKQKNKVKSYKPVVLMILDGFGIPAERRGSPWEIAQKPTFTEIEKSYPFAALQASGIAVGLPWGKEGNSEVGHLNIGAGKIILNYLPRISSAISEGTFQSNPMFVKAVDHVKQNNSSMHLLGLFSSGTVHAYSEHLFALLDLMKQNEVKNVFLHLFTDGKDAYEKEGVEFYRALEERLASQYPNVKIASIVGRKFPMNRNQNWERTKKAYDVFVDGHGETFQSPSSYIESQYKKEIFDAAVKPAARTDGEGRIKDNDAIIFYNFREDSPRQLTHAFVDMEFDKFDRKKINNLFFVTMTEYDKKLVAKTKDEKEGKIFPAFDSAAVDFPLARVVSQAGFNQLHIAESQKYAHVTFFINGGRETPFEDEDRILIPSLMVPSYSQVPEMSADGVTEAVLDNLGKYNLIVINFANADMVGHTGDLPATAKAIEKIDECIGKIMPKVLGMGGAIIITADHGNAEEKLYVMTGEQKSMHSLNPVPFYLISNKFKKETPATQEEIEKQYSDVRGTLTDVAPSVIYLLGLKKPGSMTGKSLIEKITKS